MMNQAHKIWQTPYSCLIRVTETNNSDIASWDFLQHNTSGEDESSIFNSLLFEIETVEEDPEEQRSKNRPID